MSELPLKGSAEYKRLLRRFVPKFSVTAGGCWNWTAARDPNGYGRFGVQSSTRLAHHVAYYLRHDVDPAGRVVMHTCDNPSCVKPEHLVLGTHADNVADKVSKRRHSGQRRTGDAHGMTRLNDEQAKAVRDLLGLGYSIASLTRIFGVSESPILSIRNNTRPASSTTNWKATE